MKRYWVFMSLGLGLLVSAVFSTASQAQGRDRCNDYANQMVAQDQRARQMRCPAWTSHSNYGHHYQWCQARPPQAAQTALRTWGTRFQSCQFAASGSPAARQDANRCIAYGNEMVRIDLAGRQRACRGWNSHSNRNHHIQWCQVQSEDRVIGALDHWRARLRAC